MIVIINIRRRKKEGREKERRNKDRLEYKAIKMVMLLRKGKNKSVDGIDLVTEDASSRPSTFS